MTEPCLHSAMKAASLELSCAARVAMATRAAQDNPQLAAFIDECKHGSVMEADMATMEKKGMPTGIFVEHPFTGAKVEVWVGNYVLMSYGEGAVMAVPAHDERDFGFAKKYGLPIKQVIAVEGEDYSAEAWREWYGDKNRGYCVDSGKYDGLVLRGGRRRHRHRPQGQGTRRQAGAMAPARLGRLAPALLGLPDPDHPLRRLRLRAGARRPVAGRAARGLRAGRLRQSAATNARTSSNCACPKCGKPARRETDTMDTFVDSSWYYARYCTSAATRSATTMVDERTDYWMPIDQYIGGIEHAILHLLYSRFWTKVMRDLGLVKFDEPFANLLTQGMVLNHIFSRRTDKGGIEYFAPEEVELVRDEGGQITGATSKADGRPVEYGGVGTMSKSKRNGVDPQALIEEYGADTARFFMMFASAARADARVVGFRRRGRLPLPQARLGFRPCRARGGARQAGDAATSFRRASPTCAANIHLTLKQANYDLGKMQFNTVASAAMKMLNALEKAPKDAAG